MNPITPERFIELLKGKSSIKLYCTSGEFYGEFNSIGTGRNGEWVVSNADRFNYSLCRIYESKPETPLDELDGIISKWGCTSEDWKYFDLITDWRKKYNSQLKELK